MGSLGELFWNARGSSVVYEGKTVFRIDRFPVKNGDKLKFCIESTNSPFPQGFAVDIEGKCECRGEIWKKGKRVKMIFWEDAQLVDPKNIEITVFTNKDFVVINNLWEVEYPDVSAGLYQENFNMKKRTDSWTGDCGMLIEEIPNGRRYRCNDGRPSSSFDSIVFTVKKVNL